MKKVFMLILITILCGNGCLPAAVGYMGYAMSQSNEEAARIRARAERDRLLFEQEQAVKEYERKR